MRKEPERTCVGCRNAAPQKQLMRIATDGVEGVIFDRNHKGQGRGAYLCYKKECVEKAKKRQSLERALKRPVPQPIWIELEKAVEEATAKREE